MPLSQANSRPPAAIMTLQPLRLIALMSSFITSACAGQGSIAQAADAAAIVQRQLDAYNAHDLQAFVATYSDDVTVFRVPAISPTLSGKQALSDFYRDNRFNLPKLHAELLHRSVIGNKVIDHERITGVPNGPLEAVAVYVVNNGLIQSVWLAYPE